jgi:short-subunit dehydrogenase
MLKTSELAAKRNGHQEKIERSDSMNSETALITGASSGIGLHLAREFASHGHPLVLLAPVEEELRAIAEEITKTYATKVRVVSGNLEQPELPQEIFENVR